MYNTPLDPTLAVSWIRCQERLMENLVNPNEWENRKHLVNKEVWNILNSLLVDGLGTWNHNVPCWEPPLQMQPLGTLAWRSLVPALMLVDTSSDKELRFVFRETALRYLVDRRTATSVFTEAKSGAWETFMAIRKGFQFSLRNYWKIVWWRLKGVTTTTTLDWISWNITGDIWVSLLLPHDSILGKQKMMNGWIVWVTPCCLTNIYWWFIKALQLEYQDHDFLNSF